MPRRKNEKCCSGSKGFELKTPGYADQWSAKCFQSSHPQKTLLLIRVSSVPDSDDEDDTEECRTYAVDVVDVVVVVVRLLYVR